MAEVSWKSSRLTSIVNETNVCRWLDNEGVTTPTMRSRGRNHAPDARAGNHGVRELQLDWIWAV